MQPSEFWAMGIGQWWAEYRWQAEQAEAGELARKHGGSTADWIDARRRMRERKWRREQQA